MSLNAEHVKKGGGECIPAKLYIFKAGKLAREFLLK